MFPDDIMTDANELFMNERENFEKNGGGEILYLYKYMIVERNLPIMAKAVTERLGLEQLPAPLLLRPLIPTIITPLQGRANPSAACGRHLPYEGEARGLGYLY